MRAESNLIPVESDIQQYIKNPKIILDNRSCFGFQGVEVILFAKFGKDKKADWTLC